MTASATVLMIAVGILPAYGITMMIIDQLSRKLHFLRPWVVDRAAVIYLVFLAIGNALVIVEGFIPIGAIVFKTWWEAVVNSIGSHRCNGSVSPGTVTLVGYRIC